MILGSPDFLPSPWLATTIVVMLDKILHAIAPRYTPRPPSGLDKARGLYLDLIQRCLINSIYEDPPADPGSSGVYSAAVREIGSDWPSHGHSMIGARRMFNLRCLCEYTLEHDVPGDFIETGVWRGGAAIMMRAVLAAYQDTERNIWVADSFEGLPPPDPQKYPADAGDISYTCRELAISLEQVQSNFAKYNLLDAQVRFLKGWFRDTLPSAPIERLAVLRLDGDLYESTMDSLNALYDKVSQGGFVIIDDFLLPKCRRAVEDFRAARHIREPIQEIDGSGVFWEIGA